MFSDMKESAFAGPPDREVVAPRVVETHGGVVQLRLRIDVMSNFFGGVEKVDVFFLFVKFKKENFVVAGSGMVRIFLYPRLPKKTAVKFFHLFRSSPFYFQTVVISVSQKLKDSMLLVAK